MIIEHFDKDEERPYWFTRRNIEYDNIYVMEWIYDEHEYSMKDIIIITVEWLVKMFGSFDISRFDIDYDREDNYFLVCFRDEKDAMAFKLGPPPFKTIRFITHDERKEVFKQFGYKED